MVSRSPSEQIPLPFATAALGLCLSYLVHGHIGPISATLSGFAIGILALYLEGRASPREPFILVVSDEKIKCPTCGAGASTVRKTGSPDLIFKIKGLTKEEIYRQLKSEREAEKK
jgi:hypothetical protein